MHWSKLQEKDGLLISAVLQARSDGSHWRVRLTRGDGIDVVGRNTLTKDDVSRLARGEGRDDDEGIIEHVDGWIMVGIENASTGTGGTGTKDGRWLR